MLNLGYPKYGLEFKIDCHAIHYSPFYQEVESSLGDRYLSALALELEEPSHMQTMNHSHNYSLNTSMLPTTCLTRTSLQTILSAVRREAAAAERECMGN